VLACAAAVALAPGAGTAAPRRVFTYPIPGDQVASPETQIAIRGVPAGQIGSITVTGSTSGAHDGHVQADSDGRGGSFLPSTPFTPGETVTVQTNLNIAGGSQGTFSFKVATPLRGFPPIAWPPASRQAGDVWQFRSRTDLTPAAITIVKHARTAPGDIFVAPQYGPIDDGPEIVDPNGQLIWFKPVNPRGVESVADFRVQRYQGKPVLTWWQGSVTAGVGNGIDIINDSSYRQIAAIHAANGLSADLHEFQLTPYGTALVVAAYPVVWTPPGGRSQHVLDSVVQEIDIPTGLVLFQWDSLDHVPVSDSYEPHPRTNNNPYDYFHVNSVDVDHDGNLIISARNTWAAYKVNHRSGAVIWSLGGKHSSFKLAPGVYWAFQHDVRIRANNDWFITLFDDSAGPPKIHSQSRGIKLIVNLRQKTVRQVASHVHVPPLLSDFEGNFQQLPDRHDFVGWGQQAYFTEYDPRGNLIFDARFVDSAGARPDSSYRAYRFVWHGTPGTLPAIAVFPKGNSATVYVSWNGATDVASWRVLGGSSAGALAQVGSAAKSGFETAIKIPSQTFVAVQALDRRGNIMSTSTTLKVS
jgi:Arylsulfotransferase (ASST)